MVPIKTTDFVLGVVTLDNFNTPAAFENEDIALVESLTQQSALTLENAHLFEESRRLNEELEKRVAERTEELARNTNLPIHFYGSVTSYPLVWTWIWC